MRAIPPTYLSDDDDNNIVPIRKNLPNKVEHKPMEEYHKPNQMTTRKRRLPVIGGHGTPFEYTEDEQESNDNINFSQYAGQTVIPLYDEVNFALKLAAENDFFAMCLDSLWEGESEQQFGEMLRGLVVQFKPRNAFHLHLLRNIADLQWSIERSTRYKKNIFKNRRKEPGNHGMGAGMDIGVEYNHVNRDLLGQLDKAMATYQKAIRRKSPFL